MKLTDTQLIILTRASQHPELIAMPLPTNLRGGAATKTVASMMAKGLLIEVEANTRVGDLMWRATGDGHGVTLMATESGMAAIGIEPEAQDTPEIAPQALLADPAPDAASQPLAAAPDAAEKPAKAKNTKQAALIEMLVVGTTAAEAAAGLGWEIHTVRGAIFGAIKKAGYIITSEKVDGRGRVYHATA